MPLKKGDKKTKQEVVVPMPIEMWEQLKWLSYKTNISIAELCRRGAAHIIKEYSKKYPSPST